MSRAWPALFAFAVPLLALAGPRRSQTDTDTLVLLRDDFEG
jgi:hypothetical protein